ncbi:FecR family protein [Cytophagaceae bacterium DM2B3-1]|uniref:FecR family protein n=1 Tax=Xanthocytophaga flava TaxID=3048013 RepID=A0ABT7CYD9_9BACT|nr:FecR family protein [Xanthocytophaga flavus]MDJ1469287.1 FecR family protein [Xanthocytophaga flavus]MDJ1498762.1 FecR family protein [Xanthocytophaga flavus]
MDYTHYTIEDFASDQSFIDWVHQSDPRASAYWERYLDEHPELSTKVEQARILVLNLKRAQETHQDPVVIDALWDKIQARTESKTQIHISSDTETEKPIKRSVSQIRFLAAASVLLLCLCVMVWFVSRQDTAKPRSDLYVYHNSLKEEYSEQVNQTGKPVKVLLSDGSMIVLENKSRLKYKTDYTNDSTRDVYLLGNAFFEVAKNPYKPFIVHSNEVFTKVLGTSFHVEAPEDGKNIVVSVKTGKVSVYTLKTESNVATTSITNSREGVTLLPNQCVSYQRTEQSFNKMIVDSPQIVNAKITKADFRFENTPIAEVFNTLETAYGIEIMFNAETMKNCFLTAPMGNESLFEKVKIICQTIGATYEVIDAKVIITSSGC